MGDKIKMERRRVRRKKAKGDIWDLIDTYPIFPRGKINNKLCTYIHT